MKHLPSINKCHQSWLAYCNKININMLIAIWYNVSYAKSLLIYRYFYIADGDRQETKCYNSSNITLSLTRTSTASGVSGGKSETGHHD